MYNIRNFLYERRKSMKKSKILGALALASCVMLSGCNKKPEEPSADPAIAVAELPASVNLGAGLNLDQYVTLTSLSEYSIELASASKDSASVSGHVVTPLAEGEIKFTVKSGTLSQECTITAVSQDRSKIEAYFEDVGNEYLVAEYQYDEDEDDWVQSGAVVHTKQYVFSASMGAGFLRYSEDDKDTFYFEMAYDPETYEYTGVDEDSLKLYPSAYLDLYYNPEISIDFDETVAIYDQENACEAIVISGENATYFAEETLFIPNGELYFEEGDDAPGYPVERVELVYEEGVYEGQPYSLVTAYPYVEYEGEWELFAACEFYVGEDAESFPLLDAYCVPANKPEGVDYWEYFEGFTLDKLFPSDGFVYGSSGSISLTYGWVNAQWEPIDVPSTATTGNLFGYLRNGSLDKVFNETSIWAVNYTRDSETGDITAITPTSGKMQKTVSEVTSVYNVYATPESEDPFYVEVDTENASVWADSIPTLGALREHTSWAPGSITSVSEPTEQKSYYSLVFGSSKTHDILFGICDFDEEGYLGNLKGVINAWLPDVDVEGMFNGGLFVDPTKKEVTIQYYMGWSANEFYMVNLEIKADDSLAETIAGFETAATPFIPVA